MGEKGEGINKKNKLTVTDNSMVTTRGKGGEGVERGYGEKNDDGRTLDLGGEHIVQHTDDVL